MPRSGARPRPSPKGGGGIVALALVGAAIALGGVGWALVVVNQVGQKALDRDPSPLYPSLGVITVGALLLTIARVRKIIRNRGRGLARSAATRAAGELLDDL